MSFYLYILYDRNRDKFYVGQTNNLQDRLNRHFHKRSKYTKSGNWELIYKEEYPSRTEVIKRENEIKSWKSKIKIFNLIKDYKD